MTRLSVNINKVALLRNARGGNLPDLIKFAMDCERFGAQGITVHPRPDQRHITFRDVRDLKSIVKTEFNMEGYPSGNFLKLVTEVLPDQVTLVPDAPDQITSDHGWDTLTHHGFLKEIIDELKRNKIRTSLFVDPVNKFVEGAANCGVDRIELYTESYARNFSSGRSQAIEPFIHASQTALICQLGINAGHDLNLENLRFFKKNLPDLLEVSIGHALISDALYLGIENSIQLYLKELEI